MDTCTLKAIDRTLNRLLSAESSTAEDTEISTAVTNLINVCDRLLSDALPSSRELSDVKGKRMGETIDAALESFLISTPMVTLSHANKIKVLEQSKQWYENYFDILFTKNLQDRWGEYERRTYNTLVTALQGLYYQMNNDPP